MRARFPSLPRSWKGFVGALLVFYGGVRTVLDLLQDADYALSNSDTIVGFVASSLGNAVILVLGFFLLVWAGLARPPETREATNGEPSTDISTDASTPLSWDDPGFRFEVVNKKTFRKERVPLDGFMYTNCTFEDVTFVYEGKKPYGLVAFTILGNDTDLEAASAPLGAFSRLLHVLGYVRREIQIGDELRPDANVVRVEGGKVSVLESTDGEKKRLAAEAERRSPQETTGRVPDYWDNRQMLHAALKDFYAESIGLENEDAYDEDEVKAWEDRATRLIAEALGQAEANRFLTDEDATSSTPADAGARKMWVEHRRFRLRVLIEVADSLSTLEIRPNFDGRKWVGSEQFRFKQGRSL